VLKMRIEAFHSQISSLTQILQGIGSRSKEKEREGESMLGSCLSEGRWK
jgi:hypothetical protein